MRQSCVGVASLAGGTATELLCGIFGSERITFTTYDPRATKNDTLLFVQGAAYAPVFPFATANLDDPDSGKVVSTPLTLKHQTTWATVLQGTAAVPAYQAEPAGSPLFGRPSTSTPETPTADAANEEPVLLLQSTPPSLPLPQGAAHAVPLVPYAGITSGTIPADTLASFESSILAATRKQIISAGATEAWEQRAVVRSLWQQAMLARAAGEVDLPETPQPAYRATPQGMVATVDPGSGAYLSVTLAQTVDTGGTTLPFAFKSPSQALQDALQTNQLFLVAVNPENLSQPPAVFNNVVEIAGWTMHAHVGQGVTPTSYRNVMILKYCSGTFQERIKNPNSWSNTAAFSLVQGIDPEAAAIAYTGLSQWLQDFIALATAQARNNPDSPYRHFLDLVQDPNWNGVLVLQADLDPASLPEGLKGIVGGLDLTRFAAHHFGFTASRVTVHDDFTITLNGNSSTFGLVDYLDPAYAANLAAGISPDTPIPLPKQGDYAFRILQLQVLFDNAAVKSFKSRIQLGVNRLLNTTVKQTTFAGKLMPNNGVVLEGSYIDQNGTGVYIFEQTQPSIFTLDSNLLQTVAFERIQFNCLGSIDGGQTVLNRFSVWGRFNFALLKDLDGNPLDMLSFGAAPPAEGDTPALPGGLGLAFSNLILDMSYPETTPGAMTFVERTGNLAYDLESSQVRDGSLFAGFGLQLKGFIAVNAGEHPADYGYLPVTVPIELTPLEGPWYGIVYEVTMGGPGALASAAGFSSTLLLAWAPSTTEKDSEHALFVGLSLPGAAPGAKLFSLQGVFKLSVDNISLRRQQVPASNPPTWYYCLRLDNIGIKVLGIVKLPPDATIQFFLFGDPDNTGSLGWYAAYVADNPKALEEPAPRLVCLTGDAVPESCATAVVLSPTIDRCT